MSFPLRFRNAVQFAINSHLYSNLKLITFAILFFVCFSPHRAIVRDEMKPVSVTVFGLDDLHCQKMGDENRVPGDMIRSQRAVSKRILGSIYYPLFCLSSLSISTTDSTVVIALCPYRLIEAWLRICDPSCCSFRSHSPPVESSIINHW